MTPTTEAKLARTEAKLVRLRVYVIALLAVVVFASAVIPFGVVYLQRETTQAATIEITCSGFRNQVSQLEALEQLEHRLGIPVDFTIPRLPEECP